MSKPAYTEQDYVLRSGDIEDILSGLDVSREKKSELREGLQKARAGGGAAGLPALNLSAGWDDTREEYYIVIRNMYDPRNLLDVLYERLLWEKTEDPADPAGALRTNIEKYLGVIEKKEKISLAKTKEKLAEIAIDMRRTLAVYEDGAYSEEEMERLSGSLDRAYFDPITELLESVIITLAGR
ncbi:MAG: hypothetical protein LBQ57_12475 [Spirochaetales bacterium]|jgi:hypothetical protein|nr:hypothetical protein [Spirochaetales bacterium]